LKYNINHISFIMDGNGRWASQRGLPRTMGHNEGVKKAKEVILFIKELEIPIVSLYTFSKENWKRSEEEVSFLMGLIVKHFEEEFEFYIKNKIKIIHLGDKNGINKSVLSAISNVEKETAHFDSLVVYLAFNYSGKYDIIQAVNKIIKNGAESGIKSIDEDTFSKYLLTSDIKDPDLIIRTSGEFRISNYFLWQAAYSEFYITDKLWPDIQKEDILNAVESFCNRERRYGGTKK